MHLTHGEIRLNRIGCPSAKSLSHCEFRVGWVEFEGAVLGFKVKGSDGNDEAHNKEGAIWHARGRAHCRARMRYGRMR